MKAEEKPSVKGKTIYKAPVLVIYGKVSALTQAANSGANEGSSGQNPHMGMSDRVVKQNIVKIGLHSSGVGLYLFDYKPQYRNRWGHGRQFGVMANEVEQVMPEAVSIHPDGHKMVHYGMLGITRAAH